MMGEDQEPIVNKGIQSDLETFLQRVPDEWLTLGPDAPEQAAAPEEILVARASLVDSLDRRLSKARGLVIVIIVCYCVAFALATAYVLSRWSSANVFYLIVGESGSIVALVGVLRSFWRDITALELLVTFLPNVSPERAIEIVQEWAYAKQAARGAAAGAKRATPRKKPAGRKAEGSV